MISWWWLLAVVAWVILVSKLHSKQIKEVEERWHSCIERWKYFEEQNTLQKGRAERAQEALYHIRDELLKDYGNTTGGEAGAHAWERYRLIERALEFMQDNEADPEDESWKR